ncbi:MAG: chromosome segregation protein SMC [Bacteroidetes bacterium]|nr:chromosome segregation protein SMC [Bacteroidota bacterium]MDA1119639.1 chromosome segregation protein SMC [Bacteroidota bacterium]
MLLTKLELKGFKSFGDKVTINFDKGITGIVGPNGCGKSNIVDAIRWVLGEQKIRLLRSEKTENIIFNGTKKRKATNLAEVSLSFDNTKNLLPTEYSQITITRRYYRSGESDYQLNGITCRLKDITNLFLDTGIASNSYAIIELKMVDDILNDKDNSRRALFEEAAGISKFKLRKKETLRRLDDTDIDLERVADLLFEIEKNLKSLEKQAKQTERYFKLKENYRELNVQIARITIAEHRSSFEKITKEIAIENDKKVAFSNQVAENEASIQKAKTEQIRREKLLSSRQKALNDHVHSIRQYESEKKVKNERLHFLTDKSDSLKEQLDQDKKSNDRSSFSIKSLEQEKSTAENILKENAIEVDRLKLQWDEEKERTIELQNEENDVHEKYRSKQEEVFQLNKSLEIKRIQSSSLIRELEKATSDSSSHIESIDEFVTKLKETTQARDDKGKVLEKLKQSEEDLQLRIQSKEKIIETIREQLNQTNRKLDALQNEYSLTKSMVDNLEWFPEAIKFLKKNQQWAKNAPLLSDLITCPEQYRVAVENYLEPWMNYYIVEAEDQAFQAINLLSDAAKGKAHFFILDKIKDFKSYPGKIIDNAVAATEVVEYDGEYKKLVSYLLDKVYISTNHFSKLPTDDELVFITQNGQVSKRKFSISGGSIGLFEGKRLGRAKNLDMLNQEIKALAKKLNNITSNLQTEQKDLEILRNSVRKDQLENLQIELTHINETHISIKTKHEQLQQLLTTQKTRKEDIADQIASLEKEIKKLIPLSESESEILKRLEDLYNEKTRNLKAVNEALSRKSNDYNQQNIIYHQLQNDLKSVVQEIGFKQATYESSKERINSNQQELIKTGEEIQKIIQSTESNDEELIAMYKEKEAIETTVNNAEKDYYAIRGDIDQFEKNLRDIQRNKELSDTLIMELQNSLNDTKLGLNSVKERLSVEFGIDLDELIKGEEKAQEPGEQEYELREKVQKIKNQMENIGPINPMAMEAYEEIKERHDFITSQKEDLLKAKASLLTTIAEIDTVAKATFIDAFEKIKINFIEVFRTLFSEEDDCDLRLSNEDDPLESGIDIIAKPKGKRPLTISQLSGGEKTLTATSLLFAIYLLKPAPFCIFDEVDAPLDDANIDKFNIIVRKFSKESQFIIVTHNKRTMASTDIIYGITMVEEGVSRVVPVDLRELVD